MSLKSFQSLSALMRRCLFLIIALTGALAYSQALTNGNFEAPYVPPTIAGWLKTNYLNPGLAGPTPYNGTSIVRNAGGNDLTNVLNTGAGPESLEGRTLVGKDTGDNQVFGSHLVVVFGVSGRALHHAQHFPGRSIRQEPQDPKRLVD